MVQQNALHSSIALSCALQIRMISIRRQDQALDSFGVQLTSHVERRELARALIHAFSDRKEAVVRQGQAASGHGSTESRVFQHGLDASWSQIPRRARRRRPRPLNSPASASGSRQGRAHARVGRGGAGGPGNLDPRSRAFRCLHTQCYC